MARTVPFPCHAARLRLELLDARDVPSATLLESTRSHGAELWSSVLEELRASLPTWLPAQAAHAKDEEAPGMHGPLLVLPARDAIDIFVTVDWGDGVVTEGILIQGFQGEVEVWSERVAPAGKLYQLILTVYDIRDTDAKPRVYEAEFTTSAQSTPSIEPEPPSTTDEPDPGVKLQLPPGESPELPPPPVTGPTPGRTPVHPPPSESVFRAAEVLSLSSIPVSPSLPPVPGAVDALVANPVPINEPAANTAVVVETGNTVLLANFDADLQGVTADIVPMPLDAEAAACSAVPVREGEVVHRAVETPTTDVWEPIPLNPVPDAEVAIAARNRVLELAATTVPAAVFAPEKREPTRPQPARTTYLSRSAALLVAVAVGYRTFVPRHLRDVIPGLKGTHPLC